MKRNDFTQDMVYIALFAVLIAICSWLVIPMTVPFTMQTFAVFLTLSLLGGKRGTLAVCVYLLLGAIGLPVFAGGNAGISVLLGTTGGYLVGFLCLSLLYWMAEKYWGQLPLVMAFAQLVGLFLCYAFGTAWFVSVYTRTTGAVSVSGALLWCVIPFILPDCLKLTLALALSRRLRMHVKLTAYPRGK